MEMKIESITKILRVDEESKFISIKLKKYF